MPSFSRRCSAASGFGWGVSQGGTARTLSVVVVALAQDQHGSLRHHRQRGAEPAPGRRHGFQSGPARCREPCRINCRTPRGGPRLCWPRLCRPRLCRPRRFRRCRHARRIRRVACRGPRRHHRFTDGLVRVFSNPLGLVQRLRNVGCWPSTCCRRQRRRCRASARARRAGPETGARVPLR